MGGTCSTNRIYGKCIQYFDRKSPLGIFRRRWEDNIGMDLRETVWEFMDWIYLAQERDQRRGCCEHINEPSGSI